jgi:hypothetical protein
MKKFALAALLTFLSVFALTQETQAGGLRLGITAGRVNVQVGGVVFSNFAGRLVPVFQAWVNEPYVFWRVVPDQFGRIYRIPEVRYTRRLVWVYYDQVTNSYGYFDRFGNPVPYRTGGF